MLSRGSEKCKAAGELNFYNGLVSNGHKPSAVTYDEQADVMVCGLCGKYVQAKKKSIMQPCLKCTSEGARRALDRVANVKHPDRLNGGRLGTCIDVTARRQVSFAALLPPKAARAQRKVG